MDTAIRDRAARGSYDAVVVGAGPNGLAAAITLAREGRSVLVVEANGTIGGGARTEELTLPGFRHDVGSAIFPLAVGAPFLRTLPLEKHGVEWIHPGAPLAHPLDDGSAGVLERSVVATGESLGRDGGAYRRLMAPLASGWENLAADLLGPLRVPLHPFALTRFGGLALRPARLLARDLFGGEQARALFAGNAAHGVQPLEHLATSAAALVLAAVGHAAGWPLPRGGAQAIADAMGAHLRTLGGEILTSARVERLDQLPRSRAVLCDVTPRQLLRIAGDRLPAGYQRAIKGFRHGPGVFKLDWALDGPIPWKNAACSRAGTVHLGGTLEEIATWERGVWEGRHEGRPFVLLAQQSLFDPTRAPAGKHTAWGYCHVPRGSTLDMTDAIERQVERFAPGFRDLVLARSAMGPAALERWDANLPGGDIGGGVMDLRQLFTRPRAHHVPYSTGARGLYLCSSSTPPGGGVHGLCGYYAAKAALRYSLGSS